MLVLVTYDISVVAEGGQKRLRKTAEVCANYGMRVQNSVFECEVTPAEFVGLKDKLLRTIDVEVDSVRFYLLGSRGRRRVEHVGAKPAIDPLRDSIVLKSLTLGAHVLPRRLAEA